MQGELTSVSELPPAHRCLEASPEQRVLLARRASQEIEFSHDQHNGSSVDKPCNMSVPGDSGNIPSLIQRLHSKKPHSL